MIKPKYEIGDQVWAATCNTETVYMTCPDCGGTGRIRCIMHDDTEISIDCGGCSGGYNPPSGRVSYYKRIAKADSGVITGLNIETHDGKSLVEYTVQGAYNYRYKEDKLALSYAEALIIAEALAENENALEEDKILKKEKPAKTWAWNASYHRKCLKDANRNIEYHTRKLSAANLRAKAERHQSSKPNTTTSNEE